MILLNKICTVWYNFSFSNQKNGYKIINSLAANLLIQVAKLVDTAIIKIEILENCQRFKVHGMPLERYFGKRKIKLLKRKVESAVGIELKTLL